MHALVLAYSTSRKPSLALTTRCPGTAEESSCCIGLYAGQSNSRLHIGEERSALRVHPENLPCNRPGIREPKCELPDRSGCPTLGVPTGVLRTKTREKNLDSRYHL